MGSFAKAVLFLASTSFDMGSDFLNALTFIYPEISILSILDGDDSSSSNIAENKTVTTQTSEYITESSKSIDEESRYNKTEVHTS